MNKNNPTTMRRANLPKACQQQEGKTSCWKGRCIFYLWLLGAKSRSRLHSHLPFGTCLNRVIFKEPRILFYGSVDWASLCDQGINRCSVCWGLPSSFRKLHWMFRNNIHCMTEEPGNNTRKWDWERERSVQNRRQNHCFLRSPLLPWNCCRRRTC